MIGVVCVLLFVFFLIRCLTQGRACPSRQAVSHKHKINSNKFKFKIFIYLRTRSRCNVEGRTVLVTAADTAVGIELTRELCRRGARVIMAVKVREN